MKRKLELYRISEQNKNRLGTRLHDYDFVLLEADFVNPEDYQTDLKEFFQAMQCRKDRKQLRCLIKSESFKNLRPETELAIAAHLNVKKLVHKMEKEGLSMCKAFDDLMKEERSIGKKEGKREGRREGKKQGQKEGKKQGLREGKMQGKKEERLLIANRMYQEGIEESLIRKITGCTKKEYATAVGH